MGKILSPAIVLAFALAGCHSNSSQPGQAESQPAQDPASANLANASYTTPAAQNPPPPPADQSAPAPADQGTNQEAQDQAGYSEEYPTGESAGYDDTAYDVAPEPPPQIPDYDQPDCPGDDYEWTPGYWGYSQAGYYWVPGAWVLAPYVGALWTPGYWGWDTGRYHWHLGYWGPHVGYYGGVNYGYGYGGDGYEGGYWRGRDFYYNRSVTRVNTTVVRNVYNYRVTDVYNNTRVSYNGGNGGLRYQPTPAQVAARNERHFAPLPAQRTNAEDARQNRAQFASENHGRPQTVAMNRPLNEGRSAPAPRAEDFHPAPAPAGHNPGARSAPNNPPSNNATPRSGLATRPGAERPGKGTPGGIGRSEPNRGNEPGSQPNSRAPLNAPRPEPGSGIRPQPARPMPESRPAPQPQSPPQRFNRPESRPQPQNHPAPQPERPEARPQQQPSPQREMRHPRPQPESRPAPQPESRSAPQQETHQQSRPAPPPREQPHPQGKPRDNRPQ